MVYAALVNQRQKRCPGCSSILRGNSCPVCGCRVVRVEEGQYFAIQVEVEDSEAFVLSGRVKATA